jgi:hypothetical protein
VLNVLVLLLSLAAAIRSVVQIVSTHLKHFCSVEKFQSEASRVARIELESIRDWVSIFNISSACLLLFTSFFPHGDMQASPSRLPGPDVESLQTLRQSLKDIQEMHHIHWMQIEKRLDTMEHLIRSNVTSSSSTNSSLAQANFTHNPIASGHTTIASALSFHKFSDQSEFSDQTMG